MAMCSYQTLARYDDCSRKSRARNLDDIRSRQRLDLERVRFRSKNLMMIQNRSRSLLEDLLTSSTSDSESEYAPTYGNNSTLTSPAGMDEPDCFPSTHNETPQASHQGSVSGWGMSGQSGWDSGSTTSQQPCDDFLSSQQTPWSFSPAPSPAWSSSASSSSTSGTAVTQAIMSDLLPSCLFELPEDVQAKTPASSSRGSDCTDESKFSRQLNYKQCNKRLVSPRSKSFRDIERIRSHIITLKNSLNMCNRDPSATSQVIRNHWQVILDAIQVFDKDIVTEALNILISSTENNLLLPETILHILQHGLIFSLADTIGRTADGPVPAVRLLHNIARSAPNAIPYMIDLVHRSRLLDDFADFISTGYISEAKIIIEFYHFITETTLNQIYSKSPLQPLIPEILLLTGVSKETVESFGPVSTLTKCLSPILIKNSIMKCSARTNLINSDLIDMTLHILANALKLMHILAISEEELPKHMEWIVKTLCCFRDSQIERQFASMAKGLERTIHSSKSSEHSSQGAGVDSLAVATLEKCRQFITFYEQYYGFLSGHFAEHLRKHDDVSYSN